MNPELSSRLIASGIAVGGYAAGVLFGRVASRGTQIEADRLARRAGLHHGRGTLRTIVSGLMLEAVVAVGVLLILAHADVVAGNSVSAPITVSESRSLPDIADSASDAPAVDATDDQTSVVGEIS
jgi:hypothetical protein